MKQAFMTTTTTSRADTSDFTVPVGFTVKESVPSGSIIRYLLKHGDSSWQKYDKQANEWDDAATQKLTASSVLQEGNSAEELETVPESAMLPFRNTTVDVAVAYQVSGNGAAPRVQSFIIRGEKRDAKLDEKESYRIFFPASFKKYENNHVVCDGKNISMNDDIAGVALMASGGGAGTWSHINKKGGIIS